MVTRSTPFLELTHRRSNSRAESVASESLYPYPTNG
jgi:hypothetical protein